MLYSMTGFASKEFIISTQSGAQATVSVSVKSLNARFFESTIKLPAGLLHLETTLLKLFKTKLIRGNVYCTAFVNNPSIFEGAVVPAINTVKGYAGAIETIKEALSLSDPLKLEHIIRLPNVFSLSSLPLDHNALDAFLQEVTKLTDDVIQERASEGQALLTDLQARLAVVIQEVEKIEQRALSFLEERKKKVHAALQDIGAHENLLANAQKDALYTMLDKIDIHEEIVRLKNHINHFAATVTSPEQEKGKRLDFILQELGREINTISAKCSESTISTHAINVKVEVEKMREQVQNIV